MNGSVELPDDFAVEVLAAAERLRVQTQAEIRRLHRLAGGDYEVASELSLFGQSADRNGVELVAPHLAEIKAIVARYEAALPQGSSFAPPPPPVAPSTAPPMVSSSSPRMRTFSGGPRSLLAGATRPPSSLPPEAPADYVDTYGDVGDWPGVEAAVDEAITDLETPFIPPAPVDESEVRR